MGSDKKSDKDTSKSGTKASKSEKKSGEPTTFAATNPTPSGPDR